MATITQNQLLERIESLKIEMVETKRAAEAAAERRRNEALGIFGVFLLVLSVLAYFGLQQIVAAQIHALGDRAILARAADAANRTEEIRIEATKLLYDLRDDHSQHEKTIRSIDSIADRVELLMHTTLKDLTMRDAKGKKASIQTVQISGDECFSIRFSTESQADDKYLCLER
jgi:hypothetical protein